MRCQKSVFSKAEPATRKKCLKKLMKVANFHGFKILVFEIFPSKFGADVKKLKNQGTPSSGTAITRLNKICSPRSRKIWSCSLLLLVPAHFVGRGGLSQKVPLPPSFLSPTIFPLPHSSRAFQKLEKCKRARALSSAAAVGLSLERPPRKIHAGSRARAHCF